LERPNLEVDRSESRKNKQQQIQRLVNEMDKIERTMDNITNTDLLNKKQERWSALNEEKQELEYAIAHVNYDKSEMLKTIEKAKSILINPVSIRDIEDAELKQLLIGVCFGGKIYYTKNQGLHTPDISLVYRLFSRFLVTGSPVAERTRKMLNPIYEELIKHKYLIARIHTILSSNEKRAKLL